MYYKKVFFLVNLFFGGGSLLFLIFGTTLVLNGIWIMVVSLVFSFLFFTVYIFPELLNVAKVFAISRFGSRNDNDLMSHFAEMYFMQIFEGRISTQVDITDEEQMTGFADGLIKMFSSSVLAEMAKFYPDVSEQYWVSALNSLVRVEKDVMLHIFFPNTYGGLDLISPDEKLKEKYPFMSKNILRQLIRWWKNFKIKMEWQDRVDGIQR